ncbi:hypothetical protein QOZ83_13820 [Romboutsia sedimentorum]|uniref:hypothetical protein n=1 Tax=Romboutsia sedimentorum TaxID=1368474 RepID=UPI0024DE23A3|nr:hypothetical protein [Romboutsia sedimentorum]MDK2586938.1 hypothetical protein [Romboutsia sedimentorum]
MTPTNIDTIATNLIPATYAKEVVVYIATTSEINQSIDLAYANSDLDKAIKGYANADKKIIKEGV